MVVRRIGLALLALGVRSPLSMTSLDGILAFLMGTRALFPLRLSVRMSLVVFGAHMIPPALNLAAIAAYLLGSVVHTVGDGVSIGLVRVWKCVLILGGAVANPLLVAAAIGWADTAAG